MKKLIYISILVLAPVLSFGQQFPFMDGYILNPFNMTPAYAGLYNTKTVFVDYRSDWSGIARGPTTYQLSYNDRLPGNVGIGGRFIYDKTDIFKQTMLLGTYNYEVRFGENHIVNMGLSAGFYRNSIDLAKYYNDPTYANDAVLIYGLEKSRLKFATDVSVLYRLGSLSAGILFSNVMYGSAMYNSSDIAYKPFKNFLVHASYNYTIDERWQVKPFVLVRGGQHFPTQLELSSQVSYQKKLWVSIVFRTGGIFGMGVGGEVLKGVLLNYSYNLCNNVSMNTFGSHQITLGVRFFNPKQAKQSAEK